MTHFTISIDEKNKLGKAFMKYVIDLAQATDDKVISIERVPNPTTLKTMAEVKSGKVKKIDSLEHFLESL